MRRLALGFGLCCGVFLTTAPRAEAGPPIFDIGVPPCMDDTDCRFSAGAFCHPDGSCVDCLEDEHCDEGMTCDSFNECVFECRTSADCPRSQPHCDPSSTCQECLEDEHCERGEYCLASSTCELQACEPGTTFCLRGAVRQCVDNGSQSRLLEQCEGERECTVTERGAMCIPPGSDSSSGGGMGATTATPGDGTGPSGASTSGGGGASVTSTGSGGDDDGAAADTGVSDRGCAGCDLSPSRTGGVWALLLLLGVRRRRGRLRMQ